MKETRVRTRTLVMRRVSLEEEVLPLGVGWLSQWVGSAVTATAGWRYPLELGKSPIGEFGNLGWRRDSHWVDDLGHLEEGLPLEEADTRLWVGMESHL